MGRMLVEISAELNFEFRRSVLRKYRAKKGALSIAAEEAIRLWIIKELEGKHDVGSR